MKLSGQQAWGRWAHGLLRREKQDKQEKPAKKEDNQQCQASVHKNVAANACQLMPAVFDCRSAMPGKRVQKRGRECMPAMCEGKRVQKCGRERMQAVLDYHI